MRSRVGLAFLVIVLAACGKKDGGAAESASGAPTPSAAETAPSHASDEQLRTLAVPELAAGSRADNIPDGPLVVIGQKSIVVEGRAMVVVDGGKIDATPIERWAESWAMTPAAISSQAVLIAIDPTLPSALALDVMASFAPSKQRRFALVVRTPDGPGTVPVELLDSVPSVAPRAANLDDTPVQMVLALMPAKALLWSFSGLEGTVATPRLELTAAAGGAWLTQLRDTLADIARRRWYGRTRPESEKTIVVMMDGGRASGDLANAVAAVRTDGKGDALYPDVQLVAGIDSVAAEEARIAKEAAEAIKIEETVALREEDISRYVDLLTAEGSDSHEGDMSSRRPGSDLGAQIDAVREGGASVTVGGAGGRAARGDSEPRAGMGTGPKIDGPGGISSGSDSGPSTPLGRITISGKTAIDDTSLTADDVTRKIMSAYMAGLKRCYKEALKKEPTMRGAVTLSFSVNETGRAVNPSVNGFSAEVDRCMEGLIVNWRFNVPKDADGESTTGAFRIKLGLVPD